MKNKNPNCILENLGIAKLLTTGILSLLLCCIGATSALTQAKTNISGGENPLISNLADDYGKIFKVLNNSHFIVYLKGNVVSVLNASNNEFKLQMPFPEGDELQAVSDTQTGNWADIIFLTRNQNTHEWYVWYFKDPLEWVPIHVGNPSAPVSCDQVILSRYGSKIIAVSTIGTIEVLSIFTFDHVTGNLQFFDSYAAGSTIQPGSVYTNDGETIIYSQDPKDNTVKVLSDDGMRMITGDSKYGSLLFDWDNTYHDWGKNCCPIYFHADNALEAGKVGAFSCIDNKLNLCRMYYSPWLRHDYYLYSGILDSQGCMHIGDRKDIDVGEYPDWNYIDPVDGVNDIIHYCNSSGTADDLTNLRFPFVGTYNQDGRVYPVVQSRLGLSIMDSSLLPTKAKYIRNSFGRSSNYGHYDVYETEDQLGALIALKLTGSSL